MQKNRRQHRELESIDTALRLCDTMLVDIKQPIQTYEDALSFLKTLFTDGMRLCKSREQVARIKPDNAAIIQAKFEAITALDMTLISFLEMIEKIICTIKENKNQ